MSQSIFPEAAGTIFIGESVTDGTIGSVLFVGASTLLAQDNANFFWDDTNNRLGLGTASPTTALHLANGILTLGLAGTQTGTINFNGTTSGTITLQTAAAAGTYTLTLPTTDGDASQVLTTDGAGVLSWTSPTADEWQTTSNVVNLITSTDNVTIGSSTNLAKLAVDGDTDEIQFLVQGNATQTSNLVVFETSAGADLFVLTNAGAGTFTSSAMATAFIPSGSIVPTNGMYLPAANNVGFAINSAAELVLTATDLSPAVSDGNALGTTSLMWSDLFLASGAVINFDAGDITITHSSNMLAVDGLNSMVIGGTSVTTSELVFNVNVSGTTEIIKVLPLNTTISAPVYGFSFGSGPATITFDNDASQIGILNLYPIVTRTSGTDTLLNAIISLYSNGTYQNTAGSGTTALGYYRFCFDDPIIQSRIDNISSSYICYDSSPLFSRVTAGTHTVSEAVAYKFSCSVDPSTVITSLRGLEIKQPSNSGTITLFQSIYTEGGAVVLNDNGGDYDVRIESDTNANLFFLDASANFIGIGHNAPAALLHLEGSAAKTSLFIANVAADGDPILTWLIPLATAWNMGINDGDSDKLYLTSAADGSLDSNVVLTFTTAGIASFASHVQPTANDGGQLGISGTAWSDLFLASGAVINFNAGDVTVTHAANLLTMAGGNLTLSDTAATITMGTTASGATATPTQITMGGSFADGVTPEKAKWRLYYDGTDANTYGIGISAARMNFFIATTASYDWYIASVAEMRLNATNLFPVSNDGLALGVAGTAWSDLFLAEGAVINWDSSDFTLTQAGNLLTFAGGQVTFGANTAYFTQTDNGNSGTADTIDWTLSNKQKSTITGSVTYTFTSPGGPCNLVLELVHEASATVYTITWPATVKWPGGTKISNTNTSGAVDIVSMYFDGTNYYAVGATNFS